MTHHTDPADFTTQELRAHRAELNNVLYGCRATPSADELAAAPLLEKWMLSSGAGDVALLGELVDANGNTRDVKTSALIALDEAHNWAYFSDGWMRLGACFNPHKGAPRQIMCGVVTDLRELRDYLDSLGTWAQMALDSLDKQACKS
jgi:hypothetical protein